MSIVNKQHRKIDLIFLCQTAWQENFLKSTSEWKKVTVTNLLLVCPQYKRGIELLPARWIMFVENHGDYIGDWKTKLLLNKKKSLMKDDRERHFDFSLHLNTSESTHRRRKKSKVWCAHEWPRGNIRISIFHFFSSLHEMKTSVLNEMILAKRFFTLSVSQ